MPRLQVGKLKTIDLYYWCNEQGKIDMVEEGHRTFKVGK